MAQESSVLSAQAIARRIQSRLNPVRGLTPEKLGRALDSFDAGYLATACDLWDKIVERDDTIMPVVEKRRLQASMLDWEISTVDASAEATAHKEVLEKFYNRVRTSHAIESHERGGVSLLVKQMMSSVGYRYAAHEILWDPKPGKLSAHFRFIPLQFFEARTGALRFVSEPGMYAGAELEPGSWLITVGPGLMKCTAIAYLLKRMPLQSWVSFCERAGIPILHGKTAAQKGTAEWETLVAAIQSAASETGIVTSETASITPIDLKSGGPSPHAGLVDRMDRAISRIWLGGDLSTMSAKDGVGSNPQDDQAAIFEAADAIIISEALQEYVDKRVIAWTFGEDVEPLAYFRLLPKKRVDYNIELQIDEKLIQWGVRRSKSDLAEKYGRPEPSEGEDLAVAPGRVLQGVQPDPLANESSLARRRGRAAILAAEAADQQRKAAQDILKPIVSRLEAAATQDPDLRRATVEAIQAEFPKLYARALQVGPTAAAEIERVIGEAFATGFKTSEPQK